MKGLALALAVVLGGASAAGAAERVAVPALDFIDTSGETRDQTLEHDARLALFAETLRAGLEEGGIDVVVPACDGPCTPKTTPFAAMSDATRAADAHLLLVGSIQKVSTLIGSMKLVLIDLDAGKVVCQRLLSYRGDSDEAWTRAAEYAAKDLLGACPTL